MFAKTIISLTFLFITLFGFAIVVREQQYIVFAIGLGGYCLTTVSDIFCKCEKKLY